jgi:hypothetical protein
VNPFCQKSGRKTKTKKKKKKKKKGKNGKKGSAVQIDKPRGNKYAVLQKEEEENTTRAQEQLSTSREGDNCRSIKEVSGEG